jgi:hypothetical protein
MDMEIHYVREIGYGNSPRTCKASLRAGSTRTANVGPEAERDDYRGRGAGGVALVAGRQRSRRIVRQQIIAVRSYRRPGALASLVVFMMGHHFIIFGLELNGIGVERRHPSRRSPRSATPQ